MKLTPYWLDTAPSGPDRSRAEIAGHVDVAVVGAGLTETSAAVYVAGAGASVAFLERHPLGWVPRPETVAAAASATSRPPSPGCLDRYVFTLSSSRQLTRRFENR
jgi:glycine/D-amino acid oxidase-like deaminating enzyme